MLKPMRGWEAIRQALFFVEGLSTFSKLTLAGMEIYQDPEVSTTRVFIRTIEELDDYLRPLLERMTLDSEVGYIHQLDGLDILNEVYGRIVLDYPYDNNYF